MVEKAIDEYEEMIKEFVKPLEQVARNNGHDLQRAYGRDGFRFYFHGFSAPECLYCCTVVKHISEGEKFRIWRSDVTEDGKWSHDYLMADPNCIRDLSNELSQCLSKCNYRKKK